MRTCHFKPRNSDGIISHRNFRASGNCDASALRLKPRGVPELSRLPALAKDHDRLGRVGLPRRPAHVYQALPRWVP